MADGMEQLTLEIKDLGKQIQTTMATQDEEIKKHGATMSGTAKTMTSLEQKYDALMLEFDNEKKAAREFEAKMSRAGFGSGHEEFKSAGQQFVESSEFKNYHKTGNRAKLEVKSLGISNIGNPALVRPDRQAQIIIPAQRSPRIRDLLMPGTTNSNAVEFIQEQAFFQVAGEVVSGGAAASTTVVLTSVTGLVINQPATFGSGAGTSEIKTISAINTTTKTVTVSVAFANTHAVGELVGQNVGLSGSPEESDKPQGAWRTQLLTVPVRTIAYFIKTSKQTLDDLAQLQSILDGRMALGLAIAEDWQLLNGDGTGQNLTGLLSQSKAYNRTTGGDTKLDCLRRAYTQVRLSEYTADGVIINPTDWEAIELLKGTDTRYVWVNVNDGRVSRLWRMNVVDTTAITSTKFVVGSFSMGAQLFDRQNSTVEIFEQDDRNVQQNLLTIRAEERAALTVYRPEAFVNGTLP